MKEFALFIRLVYVVSDHIKFCCVSLYLIVETFDVCADLIVFVFIASNIREHLHDLFLNCYLHQVLIWFYFCLMHFHVFFVIFNRLIKLINYWVNLGSECIVLVNLNRSCFTYDFLSWCQFFNIYLMLLIQDLVTLLRFIHEALMLQIEIKVSFHISIA